MSHMLEVLEVHRMTKVYITDTLGISSVTKLIMTPDSKWHKAVEEAVMLTSDAHSLIMLRKWMNKYMQDHDNHLPTNWKMEFIDETWDTFVVQASQSIPSKVPESSKNSS